MKKSQLKIVKGIRVQNFTSSNYRAVPNQFEIFIPNVGRIFQSYSSTIAIRLFDGSVILDQSRWDYSNTTGRYRNQFLGEGIADTRRKIDSGIYSLEDLN